MNEARFRQLFEGWLHDQLNIREQTELMDLLVDPRLEEVCEQMIGDYYDQLPVEYSMEPEVSEALFRSILPGATGAKKVSIWSNGWRGYMAAAAIVALVALTGMWWWAKNRRVSDQIVAENSYKNDVRPGGSHAILTLANGRQVMLDTAVDGAVIQEKGVRVTKIGKGLLAYKGKEGDINAYNTLTVPRGGIYQLVLPDGSHVWLNSASSLHYPTAFTGGDRTVELTGEGYFEVAPDAGKPFFVQTGGTKVAVLGTGFNIMGYADEEALKVTLVQGSIAVDRTVLKPGEQATLSGERMAVNPADLQEVLAWKDGEFRFNGTDIGAIMRQVARWYDVEIVYEGPKPVNRFGGVIPRKSEVGDLLAVLEATHKVHFKQDGNKITVIGGPKP
jgi:transmembrane sensor